MSLIEKNEDNESFINESFYPENDTSDKSSISDTVDYRILWIQEKVNNFFDLNDSYDMFTELINNKHRYYKKKLYSFLNTETYEIADLEYKQVFFYKTYRDEVVQDEIKVWEEDKRKKSKDRRHSKKSRKSKMKSNVDDSVPADEVKNASTESLTALRLDQSIGEESGEGEEGEEEEFSEKNDSDSNSLDQLMKDKSETTLVKDSHETKMFVPPPELRHKYVLRRKFVDRVVQVPVLHCFFGEIDGSDNSLNEQQLLYILRSNDALVPMYESKEECLADFPRHVIIGSLPGQFLHTMGQMLKQVFLPLAQAQFRGPEAAQDKAAKDVMASMMEAPGIGRAAETLGDLTKFQGTTFMPPSNIRRISLLAEKMKQEEKKHEDFADIPEDETSHKKIIRRSKNVPKHNVEPTKLEFLDYLTKLIESVEWTLDHIEADTLLTIPDVLKDINPRVPDSELAKHKKLILQLEDIVMSWEGHIKKVIESYTNKSPSNKSPMAEYEYWHDCESGMSLLVEQLKSPSVVKIFNILNITESPICQHFNHFAQELYTFYNTSKDNIKFLSTVLRYFKIMAESNGFDEISNVIPVLYDRLKSIWIVSKYYSVEERMVSLFERISWQLRENFIKNLEFKKIFNEPLEIISMKTNAAHKMLTLWKQCYLDTRINIELSGKGARWEFDQRRLFKDTDYLAMVSENLHEIAGVLRDFYNIFGEELKSIVDDPARIDGIVERVNQLLGPIKSAENDAFNEFNRDNWEGTLTWFRNEVRRLEIEAEVFIDDCFRALINSEEALAMLMKFRNMKTRESVQQKLAMKFDVIMQQFSKEINEVEKLFNRNKRNPPLLRYHPPMAGAIYWARQLFHRMKSSILIFQEIEELKTSDLRTFAFDQYVALAEQMKIYENSKFDEFVHKVQPILENTMCLNILTLQPYEPNIVTTRTTQMKTLKINSLKKLGSGDYVSNTGMSTKNLRIDDKTSVLMSNKSGLDEKHVSSKESIKTLGTSKSFRQSLSDKKLDASKLGKNRSSTGSANKTIKNMELMRGAILLENHMKLTVNFNTETFGIMHEAELMENVGFKLPSIIREITIQKDRLYKDYESVERMINQYNDIIDKFDDADILLLKRTLQNVEKEIQPGVTRLNWYCLNIHEYSAKCSKLLKNLTSIVTQIVQIRHDLDDLIENELARYNLFSTEDDANETKEIKNCKIFFSEVENKRTDLIRSMLKCYQSMSPMLIKLESLVEGTATGQSSSMLLYYEYYEQKIFNAFITCFVRNLEYFKHLLTTNKPTFEVDATIFASEIVLKPSENEIYTIIMRNIRDLMERIRIFPRWIAATSLECKPVKDEVSSEFVIFSFFEDIMSVQVINELIYAIQDKAHRLSQDCLRSLFNWKQYNYLWLGDKNQSCEKFAATHPTLQHFVEKFNVYDIVIDEINEVVDYYDVFSIRINLKPLLNSIKEYAMEWKQLFGNLLLKGVLEDMRELRKIIDKYRGEVELVINGLDRFKIVMQCISNIKQMAIQTEIKYFQFQEAFQLLRSLKISFPQKDEDMAYTLEKDWESLYLGALYRFSSLESTKDQFSDLTAREIQDFRSIIDEFVERFHKDGPGNCGEDLEAGMKKMEEFQQYIISLKEKLVDLKNAEVLFDLPGSDYSSFLEVEQDYNAMIQIFDMYKAQKLARDIWAKTLWENLDPQELMNGMDGYLKDFRKLPQAVRNLGVGRTLENSMKDFRNSVPLFVELKSEAMRERHWKELMDRTGKHFNMAPDRFA